MSFRLHTELAMIDSTETRPAVHPLISLLSLLLFGALGIYPMLPNNSADPGIDLERASAHVAEIAASPHPIGSHRNREVRDYLQNALRDLGLDTELQQTAVIYNHPLRAERHVRAAHVENIIARLPGRESGPAVALM
jgi:hypothetical protein